MSTRSLSNAAKAAVFAQETGDAFVILITISHPNFTDDIRVSSDPTQDLPEANIRGTISNGLEYIYCPFSISLPGDDDTGVARAQLSVDNVDRRVTEAIRSADSAVGIKIEIVLASSPDVIEMSLDGFQMAQATYNAMTVSGELSMAYFDLEPFPAKRFTPSDFPGLF